MVEQLSSKPAMSDSQVIAITSLGFQGHGYGRLPDGRYVAVPHSLPGDVVRVAVEETARRSLVGTVLDWLTRASDHVDPQCAAYDRCSGCVLRHIEHAAEQRFKTEAVAQILTRYGPPGAGELPIGWLGPPHRNAHRARGRYRVSLEGDQLRLGLRAIGASGEVVDIRQCPAQTPAFLALLQSLAAMLEANRELAADIDEVEIWSAPTDIAGRPQALVALYAAGATRERLDATLTRWAEGQGATLIWADSPPANDPTGPPGLSLALTASGGPGLAEALVATGSRGENPGALDPHAHVVIPWGSFMPTAPALYAALAEWLRGQIGAAGSRRVLDVCAGAGCLSLSVAPLVESVLAVDRDHLALASLARQAALLGHHHVATRAGRIGTILPRLGREGGRWDTAIVNPMRKPLGHELDGLAALDVRHLFYLGPAPVSAAKDAALLASQGFSPVSATAVDLHPGTAQVMLALEFRR